jgi:threonine dehydrogenase-like Zn-dependent dehydrogenase
MARLMRLVQAHRLNLVPLLTHTFSLDQISEAYDLFARRKDEVLKVAIQVR